GWLRRVDAHHHHPVSDTGVRLIELQVQVVSDWLRIQKAVETRGFAGTVVTGIACQGRLVVHQSWRFKVVASFPNLEKEPKFKLQFLDRINSPEKLTEYFMSVSVSDISGTGVDHEREFNESLSYLMRMILREQPKAYRYDPNLK